MSEFKFNTKAIKRISRNNEKNALSAYHYTSPNAFLSIVKDGFIRFSDIDYMNDKSETIYAVKVLLDFLDKHPEEYLFTRDVLGTLISKQSYTDIKNLTITTVTFNDFAGFAKQKNRSFLFCMSTKRDSLNMWNYYVQNGHYEGYALGLKLQDFLKTFDTPSELEMDAFSVYHGKVLYKEEAQFEAMGRIVEAIEKMKNAGIKPIYPFAAIMLRNKLESEGLFIKHPEFASEQEYRIVIHIADDRIPHNAQEAAKYFGKNNKYMWEDFCIKNGLVVPFLKVKIPTASLSKVLVSPILEYTLAEKGVSELLGINGFTETTVEQSKIPIRY